jgi:hypothetical protein
MTDARRPSRISADASLQHVELLHNRLLKLEALRNEAEHQLLHRLGGDYAAGRLGLQDLIDLHRDYRRLAIPGRMTRWNKAISIRWNQMRKANTWIPNGPAGSWVGRYPRFEDDACPPTNSFVVYVLFDAANEPIYVGSTGDLKTRLKTHSNQGKPFVHWQAYEAEDREAAYLLEEKLLRERLPPLNKKAGR